MLFKSFVGQALGNNYTSSSSKADLRFLLSFRRSQSVKATYGSNESVHMLHKQIIPLWSFPIYSERKSWCVRAILFVYLLHILLFVYVLYDCINGDTHVAEEEVSFIQFLYMKVNLWRNEVLAKGLKGISEVYREIQFSVDTKLNINLIQFEILYAVKEFEEWWNCKKICIRSRHIWHGFSFPSVL